MIAAEVCPNEVTWYSTVEVEYGLQGISIVSQNFKNLEEIRHDVRQFIESEKESRVTKADRHVP